MRIRNLFNLGFQLTPACLLLSILVSNLIGQTPSPNKIDEFFHLPCDDYLGRMDAMFSQADSNPNSTIYLIVYEGKERRYNAKRKRTELILPKFGTATAKFRSIKTYARWRRFPVDRIKFVSGGFRENLTVEIWLAPAGSEPPKPTPTMNKMKYGKGKPVGFCTNCC